MHLPVSVAYTYTTLFTAIHVSLSPCVSVQCTHSSCIYTVPDVTVGVIAGKMSWPAVTMRKDVGDFLQENKISSTLTFFNFNFLYFCFLHHTF